MRFAVLLTRSQNDAPNIPPMKYFECVAKRGNQPNFLESSIFRINCSTGTRNRCITVNPDFGSLRSSASLSFGLETQ